MASSTKDRLESLEAKMETVTDSLTELCAMMETLIHRDQPAKGTPPASGQSASGEETAAGGHGREEGGGGWGKGGTIKPRFTKIDFPLFTGEDPLEWSSKADQFFAYQEIPEDQKVTLASFHLNNEGFQWFRWLRDRKPLVSWDEFVEELCVRFGPSEYEDFDAMLSKLRQTGTVGDYRKEFERLMNRVQWSEKALLGCFLSGLKEAILHEVKMFKPRTLAAAVSLARAAEEKVNARRTWSSGSSRGAPEPNRRPKPTTGTEGTTVTTPIKQLSYAEMQARRAKGLCYNCDEKFSPGHKCKTLQIFVLEAEEDQGETVASPEDSKEEELEVSLQAMQGGSVGPRTMRVSDTSTESGFHSDRWRKHAQFCK